MSMSTRMGFMVSMVVMMAGSCFHDGWDGGGGEGDGDDKEERNGAK